jgi:heterodisulfide reductase subunit B
VYGLRNKMRVAYYPGCTLKTKAKNLEASALTSMSAMGIYLDEPASWSCCGAVHSLAEDDLIHHLAPIRNLSRLKEGGNEVAITLCSMCYNSMARANLLVQENKAKRETINLFMEEEIDYHGEVEVLHLLTFMAKFLGWDKVRKHVKRSLGRLRLAPYYGCTLLRPREVSIEPGATYEIMPQFIESIGGKVVEFAGMDACCGSYQIVANPEAATESAWYILRTALEAGAEGLVLSCPLCEFVLQDRQAILFRDNRIPTPIPTFYFTQLLGIALGLTARQCRFELNARSCIDLLERKGY